MRNFERIVVGLVSVGLAVTALGCFDIEEKISLKKNLSGTAVLAVSVDMQPMVAVMAAMQRSMTGNGGEPTKAELAALKKKLLAEHKGKMSKKELAKARKKLQGGMPAGVQLTKLDARIRGMVLRYEIALAFDHISKLGDVRLDDPSKPGQPGQSNPVGRPFEGMRVVEQDGTVLIVAAPPNPSPLQQGQMPPIPGGDDSPMGQTINKALGAMKVAFEIEAPFTVVESNATRNVGKTLTWEYDAAALEKASNDGFEGIRVKYRK